MQEMAGMTAPLLILIKAEIFFIDLRRHFEHMTGNFFFGLGVAGKIQLVGGAVFGRGMQKLHSLLRQLSSRP